ncbi:MAG TPA: histidinol-phosphate transaminase, partial [Acidimicrobiales bacterium]|nr:histidinol-phosphate transaminase [Acidimicrobiales bacterium]
MTAPRWSKRDDLHLVEGYHSPQVEVKVRLNTNESPAPPPRAWVDAVQAEIGRIDFNRYPDRRAGALRDAIAAFHGRRAAEVLAGNGSNEVLQALCLALGGPGRRVAAFEPTYALHSHIARITGTAVITGQRTSDFGIDLDEVRRVARESPAITFLCSPNNPTGGAERREVVEEVLAVAPGIVVVDEAYGQFAPWSALELVADDVPLVVVRTFSKTWSMAGFRLGYLVGPASLVAAVEEVVLPYHLDAVKQVAGCLALEMVGEMESRVTDLVAERERVIAALRRLDVDVWPSDANFVLFRPRRRAAREMWDGLVERSVLVRDCSSWPRLEGCLRVTIGTPAEDDAFLV